MLKTIKLVAIVTMISAVIFAWWYHGHQRYVEGKAEVQALWETDKAHRKNAADKQAAETEKFNQEKNDALKNTEFKLRDTHSNLAIALERLRDSKAVPWGESMLMAGSGCTAVSRVATDPGRTAIRIEKRIGRCEDTGSDPCYTDRNFFEQAISDALDRKSTREWASGQGIKSKPAL